MAFDERGFLNPARLIRGNGGVSELTCQGVDRSHRREPERLEEVLIDDVRTRRDALP
jgi:hypothetical protein